MKSSTNNFIFTLLLGNLLILLYFVFFSYNPTANQCLNDPLVYGYNELQNQNNGQLICQCNLASNSPTPTLYFDSNGRRFEKPVVEQPVYSANFSFTIPE